MSGRLEARRFRQIFDLGLNHENTASQTHDKEQYPDNPSAIAVNVTTETLQRFHIPRLPNA